MTYKKAGVDIDKADEFIRRIKPLIRATNTPGVLGGIGGFGGFYQVGKKGFKDPVLVSSTDGVGTKLLLAKRLNIYNTVGIDLVAMCANDIAVTGARPMFFLDYFATGSLKPEVSFKVIKGITVGCRLAGCALSGGETAELPGLYGKGDFDLAGFCVGIVEKKDILNGKGVRPGDAVLGIQSSGLHSNGFSLVRKVFSKRELSGRLGREALKPTIIYVKPLLKVFDKVRVKAAAHITGGGFLDNIPRVIPKSADVVVYRGSWRVPPIFSLIQKRAKLPSGEMFRTFNMGIGMVLILDKKYVKTARNILKRSGLRSYVIGGVIKGSGKVRII
ncbi:phosphoribosylformylglycinamidine cyclo-ligase [Candidatus Omnitrophota bacterium]